MTTKMLVVIACVLLLVSTAAALEPGDTLWTRTYGGIDDDWAMCVQQTTDGGYIIAGSTDPSFPDSSDFYLIKTDASGDTIWTRVYGGTEADQARSVQQTADGGYIVAGATMSFGAGDWDFYLMKTDTSGDTVWTRTYGGSSGDEGWSVQQTTDGGYIIAGSTLSFGAGGLDIYTVKTDSNGDTLWTRTYGSTGSEWTTSIQQTTDGGYIIAGCFDLGGGNGQDFWLVKTDSIGDTLWTKTIGGRGGDHARSVQQTTDGGYIVVGSTTSFGGGDADCYLVKTDALGDTTWTRTFGGSEYDYPQSVHQTFDGGYIFAAGTFSFGADSGDVYLVKTDSEGDTLWTRVYGGSGEDFTVSVQQTTDGGYIAAGGTESFGAGLCDAYLLRLAGEALTLSIVPGDTLVAHNDTLCYHLICQNNTPDYLQLSFKVDVRLPSGQMYGPVFGPARFGMFGNGISEGDMCHRVPPAAPTGDYWLFAEVYNSEFSAIDSMAFTVTGDGELADVSLAFREWETLLARIGDWNFLQAAAERELPARFALNGNHPNPFNASTVIEYQLPQAREVTLEVYNLLGEKIATLVKSKQQAGYRSVVWDASEVSSGLYFYKLTAGAFTETKRMMLVK